MNRLQVMKPFVAKLRLALIPWLLAAPAAGLAEEQEPNTEIVVSSRATLSSAQAAEVRADLSEIMDTLYSIGANRNITGTMRAATEAHDVLSRMTEDDLALYADMMPQLEELRRAFEEVDALAVLAPIDPNSFFRRDVGDDGPAASTPAALPDAPYSTGALSCGDTRESTDVVRGVLIALEVARAVWIAADQACGQVVAGFNASVACIAADLILFGIETAYEQLDFCVADIDSAEIFGIYDRLEHIHLDLTDAQSGVYTEPDSGSSALHNKNLIASSRDNIITEIDGAGNAITQAIMKANDKIQAAVQAAFDQQNLEIRAWRISALRIWIQADLGRETGSDRLAQLQLPASIVCDPVDVVCGSVERVNKIVAETIGQMEAAGQPTNGAQEVFEQGVLEYNAGNFKAAYARYAEAYRLASAVDVAESNRPGRGGENHDTRGERSRASR